MLLKRLASTLVCACLVLAFAPSRALGQTQSQPQEQPKAAAGERRSLTDPRAETGSRLKTLFAESASRIGSARPTEADFRRIEKRRQQEDTQPPQNQKRSKGDVAAIVILVAVVTAVCVWAIANPGNDPPPDCFNDVTNPLCN